MSRLLSFGCLLFLLFPATTNACGYYLLGEQYRIALLNPYIIGEDYSAFFYNSEVLNHGQNAHIGHDRLRNADLWAKELGPGVSGEDVMMYLYGVSLPDGLYGDNRLKSGNSTNPAQLAIEKRPDLLEYFKWIKSYETVEVADWWDEPEPETDAPDYQVLAQRGYHKAAAGSFLKERYAYQLLLLAYYADDDVAMATYFNRHFKGKTGPLADWARFHFANQWNEEGRYVVEMANAFRYAPEKNLAAYRRTKDMGAPEAYLPAAKSDAERSNLYVLAAMHRPGKALEMIRRAYEFDPGNPLIELLLVREFNKVEDWLMSHRLTNVGPAVPSFTRPDWDDNYQQNIEIIRQKSVAKDRAYLKELRTFIDSYRSGRMNFHRVLRAQAALLDEDYTAALLYSRPLVTTPDAIGAQARIVEYLATLQDKQTGKAALDVFVAQTLPRLEATFSDDDDDNLKPALSRITSQVYAERGDTVTAYFLHNRSLALPSGYEWSTEYYGRIDFLDRKVSDGMMRKVIAALSGQGLKTPLNKLLLAGDQPQVNAVRDLAGTLALRRNDLALALRYFEQIPNEWYKNNYEFSYLRESPLSDIVGTPMSFTSKADLMRQMLVLEEMSDKGGDAGAAACLALGKAWFNMGGFGGGWMMLRYGDTSSPPDGPQPWPASENHAAVPHDADDFALAYRASRTDEYLDCAESSTNDKELLAAVAFHRNALDYRRWLNDNQRPWYVDPVEGEDTSEDIHRKLYSPFVARYGATDFYRITARQCSSLGLY